jgi:putative ABC transport system permease protein
MIMRLARVVVHRLRSMFRGGREDAALQRELDLHLEQLTREHIAAGMSEREARLAARSEFGSVEWTKEQCRDMRRVSLVGDLLQDLAYAVRLLRKSPGFTLTAVCSLALGIGANTAIFSLVNAFLLRPLPFDRPERLVTLFERNVAGSEQQMSLAPGNFLDWQAASTSFDAMSAYTMRAVTLSIDAPGVEPQQAVICACSANLFSTLAVPPILGRQFRADEDRFGAPRAIVISYELWQRQFAGSPDAIGTTVRLNDQPAEIVGVMPRTFVFPNRNVDAWLPLLTSIPPPLQIRHDLHFLQVVARLRAGVTRERALAELDTIAAGYKSAHPNESTARGATVLPLHEFLVTGVRTPLVVLLGAVTCVLLIACVNIANLMLTRATVRAREIGIRSALGAGRGRIIRQLMTESLLLGLAGGAAGVGLAIWIAKLLVARAPGADSILQSGSVPIDTTMLVFAFAISIATGIAVGLVPAFRGSRADVTSELKDGTRSATSGRAHGRLRDVLVAVEVGLSLVLLVAAGLLFHSFSRLYQVEPGVRIDRTLTMSTTLPTTRYPDAAKRSAFLRELGERVRALPGVESAGLVSCPPLTGACNVLFFYIEGRPYVPGTFFTAFERSVDPQYFSAAGIRLLRGRTFAPADGVGDDVKRPRLGAIVISESMAKTFFGGDDPIGKRIFFDFEVQRERNEGVPAPRYEVIGVVSDVLPTLDSRIQPTFYRPLLDVANSGATLLVHAAVEPQSIAGEVRNEVRRLDPGLLVSQVRTMDEIVGRTTADRRFTMLLFVSFAALALLLASVGLYGVVSYAVSQRTTEIGIRMALGATSGDVNRLVVMQGLKSALAGIVLGLAGAVFAGRVLRTLLFGITPIDPLTYALVPPALFAVAALACYVPATRAAHLNPTIALRAE